MHHSQRLLFWFSLALLAGTLTLACAQKTADATPDARDGYVGTWIEQSTNGIPTPATSTRDTLAITKGDNNKLRIDKLIAAGAFTASPAGTGYQADNTPVKTGTTIAFQNGTRSEVTLDKFTIVMTGSQLTMTVSYSAKSGTQSVQQDYVEVMTKR